IGLPDQPREVSLEPVAVDAPGETVHLRRLPDLRVALRVRACQSRELREALEELDVPRGHPPIGAEPDQDESPGPIPPPERHRDGRANVVEGGRLVWRIAVLRIALADHNPALPNRAPTETGAGRLPESHDVGGEPGRAHQDVAIDLVAN